MGLIDESDLLLGPKCPSGSCLGTPFRGGLVGLKAWHASFINANVILRQTYIREFALVLWSWRPLVRILRTYLPMHT